MELESEGVLVTGAGSGIGLEVVRALLCEHRCTVWALARNGDQRLAKESTSHPGRLRVLDHDLNDPDSIHSITESIGSNRLIGLVHNAAMLSKQDFGTYSREGLAQLFHLNSVVPLLLTQALASRLEGEPAGHVVHISSMGGFQDSTKFPGLAAYSSSKAALACLAQCLAEEFKHRGIRSNCLAIGAVDTAMLRAAFPGYKAPVTPESMGEFIARFTLNGHNLFNGKVLPVSASTP